MPEQPDLLHEKQALEQRLHAAQAALDRSREKLKAFGRAVSHDIKGPVSAIGVVVRNLLAAEAERLGSGPRRTLQMVATECDRIAQLIDEVATLGKIDAHVLQLQPVAMQALAQNAVEELMAGAAADRAASAAAAHVALELGLLPVVQGDALLLGMVWQQLLANAFKFSARAEAPRVVVQSRLDGSEWAFSVSDNGAGFDPAHAERLFGMFQRLHKASEFPGTGVGLAIVERALQRMGGRVWAVSVLGAGSEFHFTLPVVPPMDDAAAAD